MSACGDCRGCIDRAQERILGEADLHLADGVFTKIIDVPKAGTHLLQHVHRYDHTTVIATGGLRVWLDGELDGEHWAPTAILVPAETAHSFEALADDTRFLCVHNISRTGKVELLSAPGVN